MWGDEERKERKERAITLPFFSFFSFFSFSVVCTGIAVHGLGEAQVLDALVGHVGPDGVATFGAADVHDEFSLYVSFCS
jgi:hypothetical protein